MIIAYIYPDAAPHFEKSLGIFSFKIIEHVKEYSSIILFILNSAGCLLA
jgi:hypothetical protein